MLIPFLLQTQTAAERLAAAQAGLDIPIGQRLIGLLGVASMLAIAWLMSYDRKSINWRLIATGLGLQALFGFIVLKTEAGRAVFRVVGDAITSLLGFQEQGARFVFGNLVQSAVPVTGDGATPTAMMAQTGAFFAFNVLPTIIFFSALMSVLYYLGIMQLIVEGLARVMQRTLGTSGAETLSASGNIFLGQTEAPLLIKPFVAKMTRSELNTVMIGGFATVAGGVLAAYVGMLSGSFPGIAAHLLAASVMNAPAGLILSKMILPETEVPETQGGMSRAASAMATATPGPGRTRWRLGGHSAEGGVIEAAANGAAQGVQLAINVAAMIMAFVALVALVNALLGGLGGLVGIDGLSLQSILGTVLRPLAWVMGVPWADTAYVGSLIGIKATLNEFVAYAQFAGDLGAGQVLDPRSAVILTYALLGFANFSSIAIQIGGIGGLAPDRKRDIASLGLRAMVAGNLAAFTSASIAGMLA
ncbi:MAG: nucleoside transporter C-terminal domain-containing protein [Gemmatimonadota bacterium]|jgi:CNT family concentrative nucleoside transporter|nr:nucleoside transporter C-terminal domain-containing protein [Gemmatimonadota bacterium]MDQ8170594.1 nucleoside transporter C-terminal domain-containing protein [Gemmatimonadota bacterium]MDQ8178924.1 nucleoside transporter C-terminal domain-containing protein [Gemmatimonadota bacterium]